ncbi:MAG TPA: tRNA-binding protein [Cytophagaceae bacterium]|jgi:tRNA-binding protein
MISWEDFEKLKIHVGTILEVEDLPKARKPAYKLLIDFGHLGKLKSSAQLTVLYSKEELIQKQVIAVVNLPPKQIGNFMSECLVLGIYGDDQEIVLLQPQRPVQNGAKIG